MFKQAVSNKLVQLRPADTEPSGPQAEFLQKRRYSYLEMLLVYSNQFAEDNFNEKPPTSKSMISKLEEWELAHLRIR